MAKHQQDQCEHSILSYIRIPRKISGTSNIIIITTLVLFHSTSQVTKPCCTE